jgi:hypothetical protein
MFVNDIDFSHFVPMKRKGDAGDALAELFEDKGVPTHLHTDGAKELTEGRWKEIRTQYGAIKQTLAERYSPWQNRAESAIWEHKKQVMRIFGQTRSPKRLWLSCCLGI